MFLGKKTINLSKLDYIAHRLLSLKIYPRVKLLSKVTGKGINDLIPYKEKYRVYPLRRLDYADTVVLECIIQTKDIDLDDFIISKEFRSTKVPKDWVTITDK